MDSGRVPEQRVANSFRRVLERGVAIDSGRIPVHSIAAAS